MCDIEEALNSYLDLMKNYCNSKIIDDYILNKLKSLILANIVKNFFLNLNTKMVVEYNLPKGNIGKIKRELNTFSVKAKKTIGSEKESFSQKDYGDFKKIINTKFKRFAVIIKEIEKEISPKKLFERLRKTYFKKKIVSDEKNLQGYFITKGLEIFIKEKNHFPSNINEIKILTKVISKDTLKKFSDAVFQNMKKRSSSLIKSLDKEKDFYKKRRKKVWEEPFVLLQSLIHTSFESIYYHRQNISKKVNDSNNHVFNALLKIHARALRISNEILILLIEGYPDGANSRWRSLYELAAISYFIAQNGNVVAQRYLKHDIIDKLNRAESYMKHHKKLRYSPIKRELNKLKRATTTLCREYGNYFKTDYGWVPKSLWGRRTGIGFNFIEEKAGISHLNPFYKLSCDQLHGGSGGLYSLGLIKQDELLLIGPSNYGLADPLQNTAISLNQITSVFLNFLPNFDSIIAIFVMQNFVKEICNTSVKVQKDIEERDRKIRGNRC